MNMRQWGLPAARTLLRSSLVGALLVGACDAKLPGGASKGTAEHKNDKYGSQDGLNPISYNDSPLVDKFLALLAEISNRAPELNREKDRRGKLRLALGTNLGMGCMEDIPVKSIELILNGEKLGDLDVSTRFAGSDDPPEATKASLFEISFGDSEWLDVVTFGHDETKNALFAPGTRRSFVPPKAGFTVGEMQRMRIKKVQAAYDIAHLCDGGGFASACKDKRKIKELERYYLGSLEVKVNGELIYARGDVDHAFASYPGEQELAKTVGLTWSDDHFMINESYVKMKQREDCTALQ